MRLILNPYRYPPPAGGGGGAVFHDTFAPAGSNTLLQDVVPDTVGTAWTLDGNSNAVSATIVRFASGTHADGRIGATANEENKRIGHFISPDPSAADYEIEIELAAIPALVDDAQSRAMLVMGRRQSDASCYGMLFTAHLDSFYRVYLVRMTGLGAVVSYSNFHGTLVGTDAWKLVLDGDQISAARKPSGGAFSTVIGPLTDATIAPAGKAGIGFGAYDSGISDINAGWRVNSFKVTEL